MRRYTNNYKPWTDEQKEFLRKNYRDLGCSACAKIVGHPVLSTQGMAWTLGLARVAKKGRAIELLRSGLTYEEVAAETGLTVRSVAVYASNARKNGVDIPLKYVRYEGDQNRRAIPKMVVTESLVRIYQQEALVRGWGSSKSAESFMAFVLAKVAKDDLFDAVLG
jgi:hypothetical protein